MWYRMRVQLSLYSEQCPISSPISAFAWRLGWVPSYNNDVRLDIHDPTQDWPHQTFAAVEKEI